MHRAAGLALASLVFAATQVAAQVSPFPAVNSGNGVLIQQRPAGSRAAGTGTLEQRQQDQARHSVQQQSCASRSGAVADRCFSDLRTTIESDKLKIQAIESGARREK